MLIFTNGHSTSVSNLLKLINNFCSFSGQKLNSDKSLIFFSNHIKRARRRILLRVTKFSEGTFPTMYLGAPLYVGSPRISYFRYLEEKVSTKIGGWMRNLLSMAGRVTLIKSVLNSMSIHCMAVLSVPKTIIQRITSLICNFLWDQGNHRRHHWIAWDKVCRPSYAGGLGIVSLDNIMLSMHGRLAWGLHCQVSLWSRFIKQRYEGVQSGSPVWNNFAHLITHMQDNTSWVLGNGSTEVDRICKSLGVTTPPHLADHPVKDVLLDPIAKPELMSVLPARVQEHFEGFYPAMVADRMIWTGHSSGCFSTKLFRESYATKFDEIKWCTSIWQCWIPKRISVFIWRLCHHGLPTEDNIKRLSIPLASMCVCCGKNEDTVKHVFFNCEVSIKIWDFLKSIFHIGRPHGIHGFTRTWLGSKPRSFMGAMRVALVCCSMWEIWKYRNALIHDGRRGSVIKEIVSWASRIQHLIKLPLTDNMAHRRSLKILGICYPEQARLHCLAGWNPYPRGWTANVAVMQTPNGMVGGIIVRDSNRVFKGGTSLLISMHGLRGLIHAFERAVLFGLEIGGSITSLQSSNLFLGDLLFSKEEELPWDAIYHRRRFLREHSGIIIKRINSGQNNAAIAMACKGDQHTYLPHDTLPNAVARAIDNDQVKLPFLGQRFQSESM